MKGAGQGGARARLHMQRYTASTLPGRDGPRTTTRAGASTARSALPLLALAIETSPSFVWAVSGFACAAGRGSVQNSRAVLGLVCSRARTRVPGK